MWRVPARSYILNIHKHIALHKPYIIYIYTYTVGPWWHTYLGYSSKGTYIFRLMVDVFFRCWWVNQVEWLKKKLLSGSIMKWTTNKAGFWIVFGVFGSWWKLWILKDKICVIHWDGWHFVKLQNITAKKGFGDLKCTSPGRWVVRVPIWSFG